jgi:hypothetical protein
MYASTLPELAGQKFNDIAEATLAIDEAIVDIFSSIKWYYDLSVKKRAHVFLEWIVAI